MSTALVFSLDELLLQRLKQDDEAAMEQIFKQYYPKLFRFAYNLIRERTQAEDAVQEVMMNIWNKRQSIKISESLNAYLYMSVRNNCLRAMSKNERKYWLDEGMEDDNRFAVDNASDLLHSKDLKGKINDAIELLPPKCALVFKLSRFEEKSYKEIAAMLDISVKTVENQMGKALMLMRKSLAPYLSEVLSLLLLMTFFPS